MLKNSFLVFYIFLSFFIFGNSLESAEILEISVDKAIELALENSTELNSIDSQINILKFRKDLSFRDYVPYIDMGFSMNNSVVFGAPDSYSKSFFVTFNQAILKGGKSIVGQQISSLNLESLNLQREKLKLELIDKTVKSFYSIIVAQKSLKLSQDLEVLLKEELVKTRKMFELKKIRKLDLIEAELYYENTKNSIKAESLKLENMISSFNSFLSIDLSDSASNLNNSSNSKNLKTSSKKQKFIDTVFSSYEVLPISDKKVEDMAKILFDENFGFKLANYKLKMLVLEERLSLLSVVPNIDTSVTLSAFDNSFPLKNFNVSGKIEVSIPIPGFPVKSTSTISKTNSNDLTTGSKLSISLFDNLDFIINQKEFSKKVELSSKNLELQKTQLKNSFFSLVNNFNRNVELYEINKKDLENLKTKVDIYSKLFTLGEVRQSEYLKLQSDFVNKQNELFKFKMNLYFMEKDIYKMVNLDFGFNSEEF